MPLGSAITYLNKMAYGLTKMPTPSGIKFDFDLPGWEVLADQVLQPGSFLLKRNKNGFKNKLIHQNTVDLAKYKSFVLNAEKGTTITSSIQIQNGAIAHWLPDSIKTL
jgi:hypothetical protein